MTHENPSDYLPQEPQFYRLTEEQAERLDRLGPGEEATQLAASFGALAVEGGFAVVVGYDEQGTERPVRLMDLGADLGTTINLDKAENDKKFPSLEDAFKKVTAEATDEERGEIEDTAVVVEQAIKRSQLREVLQSYGRLQSLLDDGARMDKTVLRNASEEIQTKMRAFYMEADSMPGGQSRRLGEAPQLLRAAQEMAETLQRSATMVRNNMASANDESRRFAGGYSEASENLERELRSETSQESLMIMRATSEVKEVLDGMLPRMQRRGEDKVQNIAHMARMVDQLGYDRSVTVEEAISTLRRVVHALEEEETDTVRSARHHDELSGNIQRLHNLLRK